MSNAEDQDDKVVISVGNPERVPGNPESYRKMANEFEDASCAISSLGELMKRVDCDRLEECTFEGIGFLLDILGKHLLNNCFEALDMAGEARKQLEINQSPDLSNGVEANRSGV